MTELTPSTGHKKIRTSHIVIAVLIAVALFQAVALFVLQKQRAEAGNNPFEKPVPAVGKVPTPAVAARSPDPWTADPFDEFDAVSRRMSNVMRQAFTMSAPLMRSLGSNSGFDFTPAVDVEETANAYIVHSDLPGLNKDKINVTVKNNILTIEGLRQTSSETQDQKKGYYSQERSYGSFSRSLNLPGPVDDSKINASYHNGVLTVTLPKSPNAKNLQKVSIQ